MHNQVTILMQSNSANESFARIAAAAFAAPFDPTIEVLNDVKTAVSEAVTNAIIHGYGASPSGASPDTASTGGDSPDAASPGGASPDKPGEVRLTMSVAENILQIEVSDTGVGIADIPKALEPMYTTKPDLERSGMGFSVIESLMDTLEVVSLTGKTGTGTTVKMTKKLS